MTKEIELENISKFKQNYDANSANKDIETQIRNLGIKKASVDKETLEKMPFDFNLEVPEIKLYDQGNAYQCNIYAFLRVVKDVMRKRGHKNIDLSATYIAFYDKLEKVNALLNELISIDDLTKEYLTSKTDSIIGIYGTFHTARSIVNKYGLVPSEAMKEVDSNYDEFLTNELLRDKIKGEFIDLIGSSKEKREKRKDFILEDVYSFLSKCMGNPPLNFNYEDRIFTPQEFKTSLVGNDLEDFITITSFNKSKFLDSFNFVPSIYIDKSEKIEHLPLERIKDAVIKQLKDGISVWFSAEESSTLDYDYNILDDKIYDYESLLGIKNIKKRDLIPLNIINYDHAMCITGAYIEDGKPKRFKVDNSFGTHGKFKGRLIMTESFFDNCVLTFIIDQKYIEE